MNGSYDLGLVALSVLIAIVVSRAALDLANHVTMARGRARALWLAGGAFAMGSGIWSMHYVGMLAFRLPVPVLYDVPTVLASLLAAVFASAVALFVVSRPALGVRRALVGSVVMGAGIATMHYTGMVAMRMPATVSYNPALFTLSVVIAIVASLVALLLAFHLRSDAIRAGDWRKLGSTMLLGAAIPAMHYTGMAAAHFAAASQPLRLRHAIAISSLGATAVAGSTFLVLALALATSMLDRHLRARERLLRARFAARLDERTRLAHELHDTLLQDFTGVALQVAAVTNRMEGPPEIVAALRDVIASAQKTLENARRAIWDMRPASPAGCDFVTTMRAAAEEGIRGTDLRLEFAVEGPVLPADPDVETAVFRVAQQAIANAVKHAAARTVRVVLTYEPTRIRLAVTDDGRGFVVDPDFRAYSGHLGLLGMQERASQVHGTLTVRSSPGHGTEIVLLVADAAREAASSGPGT